MTLGRQLCAWPLQLPTELALLENTGRGGRVNSVPRILTEFFHIRQQNQFVEVCVCVGGDTYPLGTSLGLLT